MGKKKTLQSKGARAMEMLIFIQNCICKIHHLELIPKSKLKEKWILFSSMSMCRISKNLYFKLKKKLETRHVVAKE
jgi:hypothetical protein